MDSDARRARFTELHARTELFLRPNPWDAGSARLLASWGSEALATTSQGLAWSLGRLDSEVPRDEGTATYVAGGVSSDAALDAFRAGEESA
jgi:2-methylisocitrate lyase-like PEP mutase family enzyme